MAKAKRPVSINGLEFDALISEERTLSANVPEYAVEKGFPVSDAIILQPEELQMTLFVTNTPVTWANKHGSSTSRVSDVIKKLEQLYFNSEPVKIVTTDKTYTDMAITSISFGKNLENGPSREIPISFKKISITSSKTTSIPASYGKSGKSGASTGTANTSSAKSNTSSSSNNSSNSSKGSILYNVASSVGLIK